MFALRLSRSLFRIRLQPHNGLTIPRPLPLAHCTPAFSRHMTSSLTPDTPFPAPNPTSPPWPIPATVPSPPNVPAVPSPPPYDTQRPPNTPFSFTPEQNELVSNLQKETYHHEHHFDTYRLVKLLEKKGFTRDQSIDIMGGIKHMLRDRASALRSRMLSKSDLENESYLFRAALSELRTEIAILRRNDMTLLQSEVAAITRETDALNQRLREDVAMMKSDIQLDMNNRKSETREDQKSIDVRIQEANNKFTICLGDIRTDLEAVRWETIWKGFCEYRSAWVVGLGGWL
ncbi:hypothetical protein BC938DRAFT_471300 [Jimgerdemannia flammicorona]|uniref:DUF1640-domain-containing protein n=1 Tax=Jimgerdemannia flammicorona TaxID=994334 RepID=A0A433Q8G4_9FUNG|nr:hypothetical protein BC938DRAFT_471300 [Jimgerdemannia flammicorona]